MTWASGSQTVRKLGPSSDRSPANGGSAMSGLGDKVARGINAFVENPVTNLVKGVALTLIGLSDASHTFRGDVAHGQFRVGHGLILIGLFSILGALPHLIDGLEAGARYVELREKTQEKEEVDNP